MTEEEKVEAAKLLLACGVVETLYQGLRAVKVLTEKGYIE